MTDLSSRFRNKTDALTKDLFNIEKGSSGETKCTPTVMIAAAVVPIIVFLFMYFFTPAFASKEEGGKKVRCIKKVLLYSVLFTSIGWLLMFAGVYAYPFLSTNTCVSVGK